MAKAILHARNAHRNDLVVAYGGQMHMMLGGRYRYDVSNRTPAGALLLKSGIKRTAIRSVMLSGRTKAPICDIASSGIVSTSSIVGDIPYAYFIDYPIFRVTRARDLFDYFVNLGQMTRVK